MRIRKYLMVLAALSMICGCASEDRFAYRQDFSPDSVSIKNQQARLVYADVREETQLSSWNRANWQLKDHGVAAVGSRTVEYDRREQSVRDMYQGGESFVTLRGFRVPWLTLSMGDLAWQDYSLEISLQCQDHASAGVAFRYLNSRQYYAFMLMSDQRAALFLRVQNREAKAENEAWNILAEVPWQVKAGQKYALRVIVNGARIQCFVDGRQIIDTTDACLSAGKIALLADNPALFGPVTVKGKWSKSMQSPLPACAKPCLVHKLPLTEVTGQRDFFFFDIDSDQLVEVIIAEQGKKAFAYRCLELTGEPLWYIGGIQNPITEGGDKPIQVFDINGDGRQEVVLMADFQIRVYDARSGSLVMAVPSPKPNPYFDSRNYRHDRLLGDALCPVRLQRDAPPGLYVKDRYTNLWLYDHRLRLRWQKALSTGHFPLPLDINSDGVDELLICHTLVDAGGRIRWQLALSDHVDNIAYCSLDPGNEQNHLYLAAGEMGLVKVDALSGQILARHELGHIQTISVADFLPERPGLELITQTLWREDQIHYLLDKNLTLLATWQGTFGRIFPLPWGEHGRDLALTPDGILDPMTGRVIHPPLGQTLTVMDDDRWGNGLVLVYEKDSLLIFGAGSNVTERHRVYRTIQSNYLPEVANP